MVVTGFSHANDEVPKHLLCLPSLCQPIPTLLATSLFHMHWRIQNSSQRSNFWSSIISFYPREIRFEKPLESYYLDHQRQFLPQESVFIIILTVLRRRWTGGGVVLQTRKKNENEARTNTKLPVVGQTYEISSFVHF